MASGIDFNIHSIVDGLQDVIKLDQTIKDVQSKAKEKIVIATSISPSSTRDINSLKRNIQDLKDQKKQLYDLDSKLGKGSKDSDYISNFNNLVSDIDSAITKAESEISVFQNYVKSLGTDLKHAFDNAKINLNDIIDTGDAEKARKLISDISNALFYLTDADPNFEIIDENEIEDAEKLERVLNNLSSILKSGINTNTFDKLKRGMTSLGLDTTDLEDRLRKALSGNAIQGAIDNLTKKIDSVKQKLSNHQYVNTDEIEKERAELNGLISDLEELTTIDSDLKRSVSSVKGLLTKESKQLRINESNTVFSDVKPNTTEWDLIVNKIKEAKDGAEQINRILKSSSLDSEGNIVERYQVERSNASGSKKITSQYTKQSDGTLSQNSEKVVADLQKERSAAEEATKAYNKLWEEAERANKQMDKALKTTSDSMSGLSKPKELTSQFSTLENDIANANIQLKNGELTVSEYSKKVKELISDYHKLVDIQQKRDVETYNQNVKDNAKKQKEYDDAWKEAEGINKALSKTTGLKSGLSTPAELSSEYTKLNQDIEECNQKLIKGELSVAEYNSKVNELISSYKKLVDIQQKRDVETYNKNVKAAEQQQKANEAARKEALSKSESEQKTRQYETDKALKDQLNAYKKIQEIKYKLSYTEDNGERSKLLERQKLYQEEFTNAGKILTANSELYSVEQQTNEITKIRLEYEEKIAKYKADQRESKLSNLQSSIDKYTKDYDNRKIKPTDENRSAEYEQALVKYKASIDALVEEKKRLTDLPMITDAELSKFEALEKTVKTNADALKAFSSAQKGSTELSRAKEIDKINKYLADNTRISEEAKTKLRAMLKELENNGASVNLEKLHAEFLRITNDERTAGNEGKRFLDVIKDKAWYGWAAQIASYFSLQDMIRYFKEGATVVKEFDDGLTNISYTMDVTKSQLDGIGQSVLDLSKDLKSSIDNSMQVAKIYANMNTTAEEIKKLSEPTLIMTNLTGFDAATMADDIQAVTQQFEIAAEDSMHIADVYDTVSKNIRVDYAKGIEAIAESVQVAGSTAKQAGKLQDLYVQ